MPRIATALGASASLLFIIAYCMTFLVGGEEDWRFGVFLGLCFLAAIGMSVVGVAVSLVSFYRFRTQRTMAVFGLVLNLIPSVMAAGLWIAAQIRLH